MPKFGITSLERLATCDRRLRDICCAAILRVDFTVVCGHRGKLDQDAAVAAGLSKARWPTSKHNSYPSLAVDIAPYDAAKRRITWDDKPSFEAIADVMFEEAARVGVRLRWGGDFNRDGDKTTNDAWDMPHFEIVE